MQARAGSPAPVDLGAACPFGVLGGSGITNVGTSTVNGDLGSSPTYSAPGGSLTVNGINHGNDSVSDNAQIARNAAYVDILARTGAVGHIPALDGDTLGPGIYSSGTFSLTGQLMLDGGGDPNAVFIFKAGSTLTTSSGANVSLTGGADAKNIFWAVGSSATLDTNTQFVGTIVAEASITLLTGATVDGRLLAKAQVTLGTNIINRPSCGVTAPTETDTPTFTDTHTPTWTETSSPSASPTATGTHTQTWTETSSPTSTPSWSSTSSPSASPTATGTHTPTWSPSMTLTATSSASPTATGSASPTSSPTWTSTATPTFSPTSTRTSTPTATQSSTSTATGTRTQSATPTATRTVTPTATQTATETEVNTATLTPTGTVTKTASSTATQTASRTATPTATRTATESATPTGTSTATPTETPCYCICPLTPTFTLTPVPVQAPGNSYIYPSPARGDTATIAYWLREMGDVTIRVYNQTGRPAAIFTESMAAGWHKYSLQIHKFAPGSYYYVISVRYVSGSSEVRLPQRFVVLH